MDIFPVNAENPVRIDFFGDTIEKIRPYDSVTGERLEEVKEITVTSAADAFIKKEEISKVTGLMYLEAKKAKDTKAFERMRAIADDIASKAEENVGFAGASFLMPLLEDTTDIFGLLPKDTVIILDECKLIDDRLRGIYKEHSERVLSLREGGEEIGRAHV